MKLLYSLVIPSFVAILTTKGQTSFTPIDSLDYTSVNKYSTYVNGNAYAVDFNKDGFDDIVSLNGNSIYLKLNTGANSFGESVRMYQDIDHIYSISNFADLNNDTYPDIAITTVSGIRVLFATSNTYQKTFEAKEPIYYGKLILDDFNKDGKIDLALPINNALVIYNNVGLGLISKSIFYTTSEALFSFEISDLNKDNYLDLILVSYGKIEVLLGKPGNTFTSAFSKNTSGLSFLQIGDLNLDGFLDITYLEFNGNVYTLIFNNTLNSFAEQAIFPANAIPENMFCFKLIDIKGNGTLDIVYNNFFELAYKENNGTGQFLSPAALKPNPFGPYNFSLINMDKDGLIDLLQCDIGMFEVVTFKANGTVNRTISDGYLNQFWDILYEDVDVDGFQDIVMISRAGSLQIRWGNSANDYSTYSTFKIPLDSYYGIILDANHDSLNDILITQESSTNSTNSLMLLDGIGNRQFKEPKDWKYFPDPARPFKDDINNDGSMELFVFERFGNKIAWPDLGDMNFNEFFTTSRIKTISGNGIRNVAHEDLNNDGYVDLMTANLFSKDVSLLINNKSGNFNESILTPNGTVVGIHGVGAFDYNQDQFMDLLVTTEVSNNVYALQLFLNNQLGNFVYHSSYDFESYQPEMVDILDIDGDNDLDFIISSWDYINSSVFLYDDGVIKNIGNDIVKNVGQSSRIYKDINSDGKPDVFSANFQGGSIFIQLNNSVKEPLSVETEITITEVDFKSVKLTFSPTTATGRLVMITKSIAPTAAPVDNLFYASNSQFGLGSSLGANSYVVRVGDQEALEIKGLNTATKYTISVFEYNTNLPQQTIINYTNNKIEKSFTTLNSPPQIGAIPNQTSADLRPLEVPLDIIDEDNLIGEFEFVITSTNQAVIPINNVTVINKGASLSLKLQPIDYGESLIELTVTDTASNSSKVNVHYMSIVTGIEVTGAIGLSVFPNPFKARVLVTYTNQNSELKIYNMEGQLIEQFDKIPEAVDLEGKPNGFYLFKTSDGKSVKVAKY